MIIAENAFMKWSEVKCGLEGKRKRGAGRFEERLKPLLTTLRRQGRPEDHGRIIIRTKEQQQQKKTRCAFYSEENELRTLL